jgi:hypothetical protein
MAAATPLGFNLYYATPHGLWHWKLRLTGTVSMAYGCLSALWQSGLWRREERGGGMADAVPLRRLAISVIREYN